MKLAPTANCPSGAILADGMSSEPKGAKIISYKRYFLALCRHD